MTGEPLFLVPLRLEAVAVRVAAPQAGRERIGMGPARAVAACARIGRAPHRRPVVVIGCAGGLDPDLKAGDLVVASAVHEMDRPDAVELPGAAAVAELLRSARGISGTSVQVRLAPVVSSPRILHGDEARERARSAGAVAVDMESLWCAPLARTRPFTVVRAILDVPGKDLFSTGTAKVALRCARSIGAAARALSGWRPDSVDDDSLLEVGEH